MALFLALAGCQFSLPPVVSATVERYQTGGLQRSTELNDGQMQALSTWFTQHGSGWSSSVASYVPNLLIRARHTNGDTSVINIMSGLVVIYNLSGQYEQRFPQSEMAAIQRVLEAP